MAREILFDLGKMITDRIPYKFGLKRLTENDPEFENFRKKFENDETLRIVSSVYTFMMSLPNPEEWLEMACEGVPEKIDNTHPWFRYAGEIVRDKLDTAAVLLRQQYRMFGEEGHLDRYREAWTKDSGGRTGKMFRRICWIWNFAGCRLSAA